MKGGNYGVGPAGPVGRLGLTGKKLLLGLSGRGGALGAAALGIEHAGLTVSLETILIPSPCGLRRSVFAV